MFRAALIDAADKFSLELDAHQLDQLEAFYNLVLERNRFVNLTAIVEPEDFAIKHIVDSLTILRAEPELDRERVIDVGTGAGFPGIPLKIARPLLRLTLLDSLNKRVEFLRSVVDELNLDGVDCVHARAEQAAHSELREEFDIVVARAVAKLNVLTEYCLPFSKVGGKFIALKGSELDAELDEARAAIKVLGGRSSKTIELTLPNGDARALVVIEKRTKTPSRYPRREGIPERKPLGTFSRG